MKILITGGAGCVGSHLATAWPADVKVTVLDNFYRGEEAERNWSEVESSGKKISLVRGDVQDKDLIKKLVSEADLVYHLAALPSHRLALLDPEGYARTDLMGTLNVLEASRVSEKKVPIVFASTNKVYGSRTVPLAEELEPNPQGPYAEAKFQAERWCKLYHLYYGTRINIVRLFHVVGPRTQPDREISIFTEQIISENKLKIHGRKSPSGGFAPCYASYTDVGDVVRGLVLAGNVDGFEILNLSSEKTTSVLELARLIAKELNLEFEYDEVQMLPHESLGHMGTFARARRVLNWTPSVPLETSIANFVKWRKKVGPRKDAIYK